MPVGGGMIRRDSFANLRPQMRGGVYDAGQKKMVQVSDGQQIAFAIKSPDDPVPDGFAVIEIQHGNDAASYQPIPVTVDDWTIWIPRGVPCAIPYGHLSALADCIVSDFYQREVGQPLDEIKTHRFPYTVHRMPKNVASNVVAELSAKQSMAQENIIEVR